MQFAVAIDLGGTNLRVGLVSKTGEILDLRETSTPSSSAEILKSLSSSIHALSQNHPILGVGIGFPGPLSRRDRIIRETPNLKGFTEFPLGEKLEAEVRLPVFLDNDANCATLAEQRFGSAVGAQNFLMLTLGTGIGGGIVANGRLLYGKSDGAGEIGHLILYPGGEVCGCGSRGCLEQYASARAIEKRAEKSFGRKILNPEIFSLARENDGTALQVLKSVAYDLSCGLGSLVNLFDPELIVIGGGLMTDGGEPFLGMLREETQSKCFSALMKNMKIVAAKTGNKAGILGAACLVFNESAA